MGSFNTTCAISHAPIREGDEVRLFFLASQPNWYMFDPIRHSLNQGCQCYAWDDFKVIGGISLEATYSDYNTYEFDQESLFARYIRWIIRSNYVMNVPEEGEEYNEYHDHMNVAVNDLDWETIFDMQHSGRLFLKGYGKGPLPFVGIMAIHESVYQIMLNEPYQIYVGRDEDNDNPYKTVNFEKSLAKKLAKNDQDELNELAEELKKYYTYEDWSEEKINEVALMMAQHQIDGRSDRFELNYAYTLGSTPNAEMLKLLKHNEEKDDSDETKVDLGGVTINDIKAKVHEGIYFNGRFDERNFMYRPIKTSGQEHDLVNDGIFWSKVGAAVGSIGSVWEEEEHIVTRKFSKSWQEVTVSEIQERMNNWFEPHEELYDDFQEKLDELMKDKDVVVITPEELSSDEFEFLSEFVWNARLELHIKK